MLILLLLAFLLLAAPLAAVTTPPVNLCDAGLTVELRLWEWDGDSWETASTAGAVVTDLGTGEYYVSGLPDATGDTVYQLWISSDEVPELAMASYTWRKPAPSQQLVWRADLQRPAPLVFKEGDTFGSIQLTVLSGLPEEIGEVATTATFTLYDPAEASAVISDSVASVANVVLEGETNTWGADLIYDLEAGDLDSPGELVGEFTVCYSPSECHTLPSDDTLVVTVLPSL